MKNSGLQAAILGYSESMEKNYDLGWKKGYDALMNFSYCETTFAILADEAKQILSENQVPYAKGYAQGTIDAIAQRFERHIAEQNTKEETDEDIVAALDADAKRSREIERQNKLLRSLPVNEQYRIIRSFCDKHRTR